MIFAWIHSLFQKFHFDFNFSLSTRRLRSLMKIGAIFGWPNSHNPNAMPLFQYGSAFQKCKSGVLPLYIAQYMEQLSVISSKSFWALSFIDHCFGYRKASVVVVWVACTLLYGQHDQRHGIPSSCGQVMHSSLLLAAPREFLSLHIISIATSCSSHQLYG